MTVLEKPPTQEKDPEPASSRRMRITPVRALATLVPTAFRDHLILGYEILKWDGDLAQPTVFLPLGEPVLREKIAKLHEHYGSQRDRSWFDAEVFAGLARVRGVQCHARYAEAFHAQKLVLGVAPLTGIDPVD